LPLSSSVSDTLTDWMGNSCFSSSKKPAAIYRQRAFNFFCAAKKASRITAQ
jgi:hypothetical protein